MAFNIRRIVSGSLLVLFIGGTVYGMAQHNQIIDWWRLRGYAPPASVSMLATQDTMTTYAKHLFYLNRPNIAMGTAFNTNCPSGGEKTIVLGCYIGDENGIYVYDVTDQRLKGVEEVTAAHEMLHAAYQRLSTQDRNKVDTMLQNYYDHDLHDQRIIDTISAYKKSEPHDVVNEMHSVFGTEIATLPGPLENYYTQYFTNRQAVTTFAAAYQSEFSSRQAAIKLYDSQLVQIKSSVDANNHALALQKAKIDAEANSLSASRSNGDINGYNSGVDDYNNLVNSYKALAAMTQKLIDQYNSLVSKRNAIVLQEQQLTQAITAHPVAAQ